MPVNTEYQETTPTGFSSISLNGSGYTGLASTGTISGSNATISGLVFVQGSVNISRAASNLTNAALFVGAPSQFSAGAAVAPGIAFLSEASLGFLRSAASQVQLSYGTLNVTGLSATRYASSSTTAQSGATAKLGQGELYFSVLSLTTNGGEFGFRSGNTVYRFQSTAVG